MLKQLGKDIKEMRVKKGFTQEQLSRISKTSVSYLSRIENGGANLTLECLIKISRGLKISASDLVKNI